MDTLAAGDRDLIDLVAADQRVANMAEFAKVSHMVEFVDERRAAGEAEGGGRIGRLEVTAAMFELSLALMVPVATVQTLVARGRDLRSRMPRVWAAWGLGRIGLGAARLIDEAVDRLARPESRRVLDESVVDQATEKTPAQLRSWLDRFVERMEADKARDRHRRAVKDRAVWVRQGQDGMGWLTGLLPGTELAAIDARLDAIARGLGAADGRTMEQRRADILCDTLLGRMANGCETGTGSASAGVVPAATIGVIVPIQSLVGMGDEPGEFADRNGSVPADLVRSLAVRPGTVFWRLLTDEVGHLLDATELGRFPSRKLGFAVRLRDGTSVFPTSSVPAVRSDLDHTRPHCGHRACIEHGPTTAANLGALDRRVHQQKTDGNLRLRRTRSGSFEWTTRTGHRYTYRADPLPVADWDTNPYGFPPGVPGDDSVEVADAYVDDPSEQQAI